MRGVEFHETAMAIQFFRKQVPAVITQLTRIADALEEQNRVVKERAEMVVKISEMTNSGVMGDA